ncbi:MAG: efflux RND transporter permease subunit [Spirochaetaceae bacterium]|nr:efflux RND transporter permease subunit [Spirochaetaceae bacterium]
MSISKNVVGRPTTVFIIFILLIGLGIYAATDLAIDLYPEIEPPILIVMTTYPGAGPQEIEKTLSRPIESSLSNISKVDKITSTSSKGTSTIIVRFTYGANMSEASSDIRDSLDILKKWLPSDADSPIIFKFDPSMIPIMGLSVSGNRTPDELREIAENIVQPRIEQVEGVGLSSVTGGQEKAIRVEIPQNRLEAYGLTLTQVSNMIRGQNFQISAGSILADNKNLLVTTTGEYKSLDEIKNTVIAYKGGAPDPMSMTASDVKSIRLRDIANVYSGYKREDTLVYINGKPGVQLIVQKQSGTNSVQIAENVRTRLKKINKEMPSGIKVSEIFNTTDIIKNSINQVSSTALIGAMLAVIVLFIFLRSLKTTFIIGLAIPVSLIITLMFMYFAGLTLNIMTLAGLALGIGMLVDNSIVILENIFRYREKGTKLTTAAILGSQEMINAITSSTLTTICVFAPIIIFKSQLDIYGELFSGLSFTVVISLTASLIVALTLIPVLASHYLPISSRNQRPLKGFLRVIDDIMESLFTSLDNAYKRGVARVLRHKVITIVTIIIIFIGSMALIPGAGFEFMPAQMNDMIQVSVELPQGTKLSETESVLLQLESIIRKEINGYEEIIIQAGSKSFMGFLGAAETNKGTLMVNLPAFDKRIDNSDTVKKKLRSHFNDFPSAVFSFSSNMGGGFSSSPVDILIKTEDLDKSKEVAEKIKALLEERFPEVTEPMIDLKNGLPQVEIMIDRDKLYSFGLNIYSVGQEIKASIDGIAASRYRDGGSEYDIIVILEDKDRDELPDLDKIFVMNAAGKRIALANFASYKRTMGPVSIIRENQTRTVHVTAGTVPGTSLNDISVKIEKMVKEEIPAEEGLIIEFSGDFANLMKYGIKLIIIIFVAIFLVFGVMASLFESFLDPFIILFTIPLSLIGVVLLYIMTGEMFNILTAVGLIMLAGIIVNNGIVLVDYTNLLRKRGLSINDACIEAGGNRLRPILMTTLTTVLGLIPMAFFPGEAAALVNPIGKAVVGGLTVGALLTLFLIPVIYAIFNESSLKHSLKKEAKKLKRREERLLLESKEENK